ncbi:hypothetical protein GCM10009619_19040 [Williamsia maris]
MPEKPFRHPGSGRDLLGGGRLVPDIGEDVDGGRDELVSALVGAEPTADGRVGHVRSPTTTAITPTITTAMPIISTRIHTG